MSRPKGSVNKSRLNFTELWRNHYTPEDIRKCYNVTIELLNSEDPNHRMWAVDFIAKKFIVSADKLEEADAIRDSAIDKEEYERLVKEALEALKG